MTLEEKIEELKRLREGGTSGKWFASGNGVHVGSRCVATTHSLIPITKHMDAAFISFAANEALPLIEALQGQVSELEAFARECVELGEKQAAEFDRVWKALGCLGEEHSIDDAIAKITALEGENRRLRDVVVNLVSADYAHEDEFSAQIQCLGCDSRYFYEWADVRHAEDCEYLQELADVMASTTEGGSK